jgi:hypothetical protein
MTRAMIAAVKQAASCGLSTELAAAAGLGLPVGGLTMSLGGHVG